MPLSVKNLLQSQNLQIKGLVKWGTPFEADYYGVYVVALSDDPDQNKKLLERPTFSESKIQTWINTATEMKIDGELPTIEKLKKRLTEFWFPDENIVYIGKAEKQKVEDRVSQFYSHKVGKRSPHKGGFWIKLLSNLSELNIYYSEIKDAPKVETTEKSLQKYFMSNVSDESLKNIRDKNLTLPFGNLKFGGKIKKHGISKQYKS